MSTKTKNKKLAELIYAKALTDLIEDRYFDKKKAKTVTFCIMVDGYIQKHQKERDRYSLKHLSPFFGNMTLAEIESEMVDDYIDKRLNEGAAHSTVYKEFALVEGCSM